MMQVLLTALQRHGIPHHAVLGSTPDMEAAATGDRAREISTWLRNHTQPASAPSSATAPGGPGGSSAATRCGWAPSSSSSSAIWQFRWRQEEPILTRIAVGGRQRRRRYEVASWVAIDDLNLAGMDAEFMAGHFVQTTMEEGLSQSCAERGLQILLGA